MIKEILQKESDNRKNNIPSVENDIAESIKIAISKSDFDDFGSVKLIYSNMNETESNMKKLSIERILNKSENKTWIVEYTFSITNVRPDTIKKCSLGVEIVFRIFNGE